MGSTPFYTIFFVPTCTTSFQVDHQLGGVQEVVGVVVVGGGAVVALGKGVAGQGPLYQLALRQGSKQQADGEEDQHFLFHFQTGLVQSEHCLSYLRLSRLFDIEQ